MRPTRCCVDRPEGIEGEGHPEHLMPGANSAVAEGGTRSLARFAAVCYTSIVICSTLENPHFVAPPDFSLVSTWM